MLELKEADLDKQRNTVRLEHKRIEMSQMYDAEIDSYMRIMRGKDARIGELADTVKKALRMMQHPRLMQLVVRELHYDRIEYTWEQRLAAAKKEMDFSAKEEKEIRDMGIVLCPRTMKELFAYARAKETDAKNRADGDEVALLRKRNLSLEGKRLRVETQARRHNRYPLNAETAEHDEKLNRM